MNQRKGRSGQALVEYVMTLILMISVFTIIDRQLRRSLGRIWLTIAKEIAAPCPGCRGPEEIR